MGRVPNLAKRLMLDCVVPGVFRSFGRESGVCDRLVGYGKEFET